MTGATPSAERIRMRLAIHGAVQGVGFRPFAFRLARKLGLAGWVMNSPQGVVIEVEGSAALVEDFRLRVASEKPSLAAINSMESSVLDARGDADFEIRGSDQAGEKTALVLPDLATCLDCRAEIFDATSRRYRYPFTNCTHCGPRFSIIEALPYDRPNTTMRHFAMCDACRAEYENPLDRRFHAEPIACPQCGPQLELWNSSGHVISSHDQALTDLAAAVRNGVIVAVKGLGGFHLVVDARNQESIERLRYLKHREEKPFAVMYPSLELIEKHCVVSALERRLLLSPEAPIVLLRRKNTQPGLSPAVAPGNPYVGVMLPYTPLHHLLLAELGFPIVATSGNLADEPICLEEHEALARLGGIASLFLAHNRPIARHVDDSLVTIVAGREMVLRRARGFAPLPVPVKKESASILAVGAHFKNAIALSAGGRVFISQHIGNLDTSEAFDAFQRVVHDFERLYEVRPGRIACDLHPDYLSTKFATQRTACVEAVQHHVAHVAACMAENQIEGPALGVSWDGTGYGTDDTVWGGEFILVDGPTWRRVAHLRTFRLPGGEAAIREPRRAALGLLYSVFGDAAFAMKHLPPLQAFSETDLRNLKTMLERRVNCPLTSSAGRLFDGVAALSGIRQQSTFEGQAAMELEFALDGCQSRVLYDFGLEKSGENGTSTIVADWGPMVQAIVQDVSCGTGSGEISARFHNTLVEMIVEVAHRIGQTCVALSGGCFQNRHLSERAIARLREEGFLPYWPQRVPPNDGGIAFGQAVIASYSKNSRGA